MLPIRANFQTLSVEHLNLEGPRNQGNEQNQKTKQ
jgi:hypothetical protein